MKLFYFSLLAWSGRKSLVSFGENHISVPTSFVVSGCYPGFSWEYFDSWKQKQQQKNCVLGILGRGISKYAKITTSSQGASFSENPEDCEEARRVLDDSSNGLGCPGLDLTLNTHPMTLDMSLHLSSGDSNCSYLIYMYYSARYYNVLIPVPLLWKDLNWHCSRKGSPEISIMYSQYPVSWKGGVGVKVEVGCH